MPRPYPPEFRQRALDLVRSGRPVAEVAGLLGIAESCLYRWKHQDLAGRGLKPGTGRAESAELAAARRRIRYLEEENKILRKAAAAVSQVDPSRVADRPDRPGPRRLLRHLRPAPGPRRAAAHSRPGGRPQHGNAADAPRRDLRAAAAPPGQAGAVPENGH